MIALGSGEPTRTICSTVIAEAFGRIGYPILPRVERLAAGQSGISQFRRREILHIRHYSLYAPADFDISPYFEIVKATLEEGAQLFFAAVETDKIVGEPGRRRGS